MCRFQFFLERVPFVVLGEFVNAIAAAKQALANSERLCQLDDVGSDVFDLLTVLCFDRDKAVGNQPAEIQRDLRAVAVSYRHWPAILTRPVRLLQLSKRGKEFARCRDADRVASDGFFQLIGWKTPGVGGAGRCENTCRQCKESQFGQTNHAHDYACLRQIANGNLWRPNRRRTW